MDLLRVARVGVHEHELADVVQKGGDEQAVAVRVAGGRGEAVGGALDSDGVQAEALGSGVPGLAALEELEGLGVGREALDGLGREHLDGGDDRLDLAALGRVHPVGEAHHGDDERDVGLDGAHDVARRGALLGDQGQQAVARLGQRREDLKGLEGSRQSLAVPLIAGTADDGVRRVAAGAGPYGGRCGCGAHERVIGRSKRFWSLARGHGQVTLTLYRHGGPMVETPAMFPSYPANYASSARPTLARVSSRPSSATVSKIPGETVVPVKATRKGWKICLALRSVRSTTPRSASSTVSAVHGSGRVASASAPPPAPRADSRDSRNFSRASGHRRTVVERAGQRPELVERRDLLLRDRHRVARGRSRPVNSSSRAGQVLVDNSRT